jgi:hypothetical protein
VSRGAQRNIEVALERWERLGAVRHPLLALAPVGLQFASFLPLWFLARGLARALAIPDEAPVIEQTYGLVWLALVLIAMLVFMLMGFSLGVVLNVLVARLGFGWPMAAVVEAGICPAFVSPDAWRRSGIAAAKRKSDARREHLWDREIDG